MQKYHTKTKAAVTRETILVHKSFLADVLQLCIVLLGPRKQVDKTCLFSSD